MANGPDTENWTITVTLRELWQARMVLDTVNRGETQGIAWLTRTDNKRLWIIHHRATTAWIVADCERDDPRFALPITQNFLQKMIELAVLGGESLVLTPDPDDGSIVAVCGANFVSVDHPDGLTFTEEDMPYVPDSNGDPGHHALAVVSMDDTKFFARTIYNNKGDAGDEMPPFVHLLISDGRLSWTVDWTRFGEGRTTGSVEARTTGTSRLEFFPYALADVIIAMDPEDTDEVRFFVESEEPDYIYVVSDTWGTRTVLDSEHVARWNSRLVHAMIEYGFESEYERTGPRLPEFHKVGFEDTEIRLTIVPSDGRTGDHIRLTHVIGKNIIESSGLLAEVNSINTTLVGARIVVSEGALVVVTDFPATSLGSFADHYKMFKAAMDTTSGLDMFLPLFATAGVGTDPGEYP